MSQLQLSKSELVFIRDNWTCQLQISPDCTSKRERKDFKRKYLTAHHVKPRCHWGLGYVSNLLTTCKFCHRVWQTPRFTGPRISWDMPNLQKLATKVPHNRIHVPCFFFESRRGWVQNRTEQRDIVRMGLNRI